MHICESSAILSLGNAVSSFPHSSYRLALLPRLPCFGSVCQSCYGISRFFAECRDSLEIRLLYKERFKVRLVFWGGGGGGT